MNIIISFYKIEKVNHNNIMFKNKHIITKLLVLKKKPKPERKIEKLKKINEW